MIGSVSLTGGGFSVYDLWQVLSAVLASLPVWTCALVYAVVRAGRGNMKQSSGIGVLIALVLAVLLSITGCAQMFTS